MKNINTITLANTTYQNNANITDVDLALVPWTNNSMQSAFWNCFNLTNVTNINDNIIDMSRTFGHCDSLVNAPVIPNSVKNITSTFYYCNNLVNAPVISNSVIDMSRTFYGCYNLVNAPVIPNSVKNMSEAFTSCSNLVNVSAIPNSVINMAITFDGCRNLVNAPDMSNATNVIDMRDTFNNCDRLVNAPVIPNSVIIMNSTFRDCHSLVNAPDMSNATNVIDMYGTFVDCQSLINAPDMSNAKSVTNMGATFAGCSNLVNAPVIPNSVIYMNKTFAYCSNLVNAPVIPNSVIYMNETFSSCGRLTNDIIIETYNVTCAYGCFGGTSLDKNVYMPFYYDNSAKTQTYNAFINAGYSATNRVNGALLMDPRVNDWRYDILSNDTRLLYEYLGTETNIVVPNVVTMINNYTSGTNTTEANTPFYKNEDVINADLTYTPWENDSMAYGFYQARNVYSVRNINTNVTNYHRAFSGCTNLFEISLPPTIYEVESVDMQYAFQDCVNLTYINAPVSIFYNTSNTVGIFDGCTNLSVINITGEYIPGAPTTTNVSRAFAGTAITVIPAMPGTIEDLSWTFENCHHLVNINALPNGGVNMQGTFYNCSNLTEFKNITSTHLDDMSWTFYNCVNLTTAGTISNTATNMYQTFYNCSNLTSLPEIPTNVSNISGAFYNCALVNSVSTIPVNVTDIAETFDGCSNLTGDINIESEIITNAINAFANTTANKDVYIPFQNNGVNTATYNAFIAAGYSTTTRVNGVLLKDFNSEDIDLSDYDYTIDADNNVILTNYKGTATDIVTPHLSN